MSAIFLLPVCLTYWPIKYTTPHTSTPTLIIPTKFEDDMTIHCRVTAFLSADMSRDLVTLAFDLLTLNSCHTWRVTWSTSTLSPSLKTHWLALKMRTWPLRMRRITWPVNRGSKTITYLESPTRFAYSLYNFYWATTTIRGRLLSSRPMLKPFSGEKNSKSRRNGAQNGGFGGKWWSKP